MATKTSKLHTTFTGDDKHFQRAAGRVMKSGTQMGAMAGKLKSAFAAMGGAMVVRGLIEKFDRIGKVAKRVGMSAEELQRLAHAAELSGTNFESLQAILTRLQRRIGEALQSPTTAAAKAFKELGLNAEELRQMGLKEQFFAVADAFNATGGGVEGVASLMKILDTEVRNLIPLFQEGSTGIQTMMSSATVATDATVEALEKASDRLTEIRNKTTAIAANLLVASHDVWHRFSAKVSGDLLTVTEGVKQLLSLIPGVDIPHLSEDEIKAGVRSVITGKPHSIGYRPPTSEEKEAEKRREIRDKWLGGWKKMEGEKDIDFINLMTGDWGQSLTKRTFGDAGENPFAEIIKEWQEKNRNPAWLRINRAEEKQKEQKQQLMLSGQFSEFVQTAGIGATFAGKSPQQVQLEKQTDIMERQLEGIREFNSSIEELTDNTTDR